MIVCQIERAKINGKEAGIGEPS